MVKTTPNPTAKRVSWLIIGLTGLALLGGLALFAGAAGAQTSADYPDSVASGNQTVSDGDTVFVDVEFNNNDPANTSALVSISENGSEVTNETLNVNSSDFDSGENTTVKTVSFDVADDLNITNETEIHVEVLATNEQYVESAQASVESPTTGGGGLLPSTEGWPIPVEFVLAIVGAVGVIGAAVVVSRGR